MSLNIISQGYVGYIRILTEFKYFNYRPISIVENHTICQSIKFRLFLSFVTFNLVF